ncbi:MAG: YdcF family protein [Deltaproteobacteria bacterium]|nr:YdcF family protein [Deltaproteobacteria bacterium]
MKWRVQILFPIFFLFVLVLYLFLNFAGSLKGVETTGKSADAIVVLTGGTGRMDVGLGLLRKRRGRVLMLSGVDRDADVDSIFLNRVSVAERLDIVLEKNSKSTYGNAVEVRRFMEVRRFKSMLLITSTYHMERALLIFRRVMPADTGIEPYPVESPNFDAQRWWKGRGLAIAGAEFVKYCWYYLRFGLEDAAA